MNELITPILIILTIVIILMLIIKIIELSKKVKKSQNNTGVEELNNKTNESYPYHSKLLLTPNEYKFYKQLKPITDKYELKILPKIRMADLIEVNKGLNSSERKSAENKILQKHFDFVLTNQDLYVSCIIELDDNSHNNENTKKRDEIKNKICETVKLPLIRCTDINGVEEQICEKIKCIKSK